MKLISFHILYTLKTLAQLACLLQVWDTIGTSVSGMEVLWTPGTLREMLVSEWLISTEQIYHFTILWLKLSPLVTNISNLHLLLLTQTECINSQVRMVSPLILATMSSMIPSHQEWNGKPLERFWRKKTLLGKFTNSTTTLETMLWNGSNNIRMLHQVIHFTTEA